MREVLHYVQYTADELTAQMRKDVERAVRGGKNLADTNRGSCCASTRGGWKGIRIWRSRKRRSTAQRA